LANDPLAEVANRLHSVAIHLLRRAAATDRATGLTPERLSLLSVLAYGGPMPVNRIAAVEGVSTAAVSRSLGALEALGLAERTRGGAADKRVVTAKITAAGRALLQRGRRDRLRILSGLLRELRPQDVRAIEAALDPLESVLGRAASRSR
jgi:DNA-binding MarR family transcriptional regulator